MTRFLASMLLVLGTLTPALALPAPASATCGDLSAACLGTVRIVDGRPLLGDLLRCEAIYYMCLARQI